MDKEKMLKYIEFELENNELYLIEKQNLPAKIRSRFNGKISQLNELKGLIKNGVFDHETKIQMQ